MNTPQVGMIPPPSAPRHWHHWVLLLTLFLSGGIIGFAVGGFWMRDRMAFMMKNPDQVMERIFPHLRSELGLNDDQAQKVEEILRQHFASMEFVRAEFIPKQMGEFEVMGSKVAQILTPEQRTKWSIMLLGAKQRHIPSSPGKQAVADTVFRRFDTDKDGSITENEVPPFAWGKIKIADMDGDGKVTLSEYQKAFP